MEIEDILTSLRWLLRKMNTSCVFILINSLSWKAGSQRARSVLDFFTCILSFENYGWYT